MGVVAESVYVSLRGGIAIALYNSCSPLWIVECTLLNVGLLVHPSIFYKKLMKFIFLIHTHETYLGLAQQPLSLCYI